MRKRIDALAKQYELPHWFIRLNYWGLSPVAVWPLVFFTTIFLFDHPQNLAATYGFFFLINSYPALLYGNLLLSLRLYVTARPLAILLPLFPLTGFAYLIIYLFFV